MRYSHERRFACRGAVNAVPEICSAYKPYGQCCGELRPCGSAPGNASVANSLPKPLWYPRSPGCDTIALIESCRDVGAAKHTVYNIGAAEVANWKTMIKGSQLDRAASAADELKCRIVSFMRGASTEITPSEEDRLPDLKSLLPAGTAVHV